MHHVCIEIQRLVLLLNFGNPSFTSQTSLFCFRFVFFLFFFEGRGTCVGVVVSAIINQHPVEADETKISREGGLLSETNGEGDGVGEGAVGH